MCIRDRYKGSSIHEALKVFKRESKTIYFDDLGIFPGMKSNKFKQVYKNNHAINKLKKIYSWSEDDLNDRNSQCHESSTIKQLNRSLIMNIKVEIKNIYGKELIYPVCEKAKLFANLIGQKTLGELGYSEYNINSIKELGYSVEVAVSYTHLTLPTIYSV